MSILNDRILHAWAAAGGLVPFNPENVNPASVDLTWSGRYKLAHSTRWGEVCDTNALTIRPGELYLLDTAEIVTMPDDCAGQLNLKSSIGRMGLEHLHAGFFDPGFTGTATLEIFNPSPFQITITRGQRIVQIVLMRMEEPPMKSYRQTGRYNGQNQPQQARAAK